MDKKVKHLIVDILIFGLGIVGSKLILFLLVPLYTMTLTEAEYGIADLVYTLGQFVAPVISLAIYNALLRFGMGKDEKQEDVLLNSMLVWVIGSLGMLLLIPILHIYEAVSPWKWYLYFYIVVFFANSNAAAYLKAKGKNKIYALLSIAQAFILVLCSILFLNYLKWGVGGYLLTLVLSNGIIAIVGMLLGNVHKDLKKAKFHKALLRSMIIYSLPFVLNDISWGIIHSTDKVMIERMLGGTVLGLYTTAAKIPSLINVITTVFTQAWTLSSIKEYENDNDINYYSKIYNIYSVTMFGACIAIVALVKPFIRIYVGVDFFAAWKFVPLLMVSAIFLGIASFLNAFYSAMKKSKNMMITIVIAALTNVCLNFIFVPICGVWGAIIGTLVSYMLLAIIRMVDIYKYLSIKYNVVKHIIMTIIVLGQALLVSIDVCGEIVSIIAMIIFVIYTRKDIVNIFKYCCDLIKNIRNKLKSSLK